MDLNKDFWNSRYEASNIGWDIGGISTPLKVYFDQLTDSTLDFRVYGRRVKHQENINNIIYTKTRIEPTEFGWQATIMFDI